VIKLCNVPNVSEIEQSAAELLII